MADPDILTKILRHKAEEVHEAAQSVSLRAMSERAQSAAPVRGFRTALAKRIDAGAAAVIAEIKRASPSKGLIRPDFDPPDIARSYENGGATAISVLTDRKFFQGHPEHLRAARQPLRPEIHNLAAGGHAERSVSL